MDVSAWTFQHGRSNLQQFKFADFYDMTFDAKWHPSSGLDVAISPKYTNLVPPDSIRECSFEVVALRAPLSKGSKRSWKGLSYLEEQCKGTLNKGRKTEQINFLSEQSVPVDTRNGIRRVSWPLGMATFIKQDDMHLYINYDGIKIRLILAMEPFLLISDPLGNPPLGGVRDCEASHDVKFMLQDGTILSGHGVVVAAFSEALRKMIYSPDFAKFSGKPICCFSDFPADAVRLVFDLIYDPGMDMLAGIRFECLLDAMLVCHAYGIQRILNILNRLFHIQSGSNRHGLPAGWTVKQFMQTMTVAYTLNDSDILRRCLHFYNWGHYHNSQKNEFLCHPDFLEFKRHNSDMFMKMIEVDKKRPRHK